MIVMVGAVSVTACALFCEKPLTFSRRVSTMPPASIVIELLAVIVKTLAVADAAISALMVALLTNPALPALLSPAAPMMTSSRSKPIPTELDEICAPAATVRALAESTTLTVPPPLITA